jgi:hypothetical protein
MHKSGALKGASENFVKILGIICAAAVAGVVICPFTAAQTDKDNRANPVLFRHS